MFPPCLPATIAEKKVIGFNPFLSDQKGFKLMCPDPPPRSSPERVLGGHFEPKKSGSPEPKKVVHLNQFCVTVFGFRKLDPGGNALILMNLPFHSPADPVFRNRF